MDQPTADALAELEDPLSNDPSEEHYDDGDVTAVLKLDEPPFQIAKGKYKGLVLPRMIGVKPSYVMQVEALRLEIMEDPEFQRHATTIAQTYAQLRREAEEMAKALSELKLRMTATMLLMIDQFEVEATTAWTGANGDNLRVQPEPHLVVIDKEAFRVWCQANGFESQMVLPWGTANKMVKEMLLEGTSEPPGCQAFMRPKVVFTKGQK